ncbi:MAG: hypothetical protein KBS99_00065 [Prevotellaceae bacterium]|nr:hypothetical protein [Candidatus Colivivens caballi]
MNKARLAEIVIITGELLILVGAATWITGWEMSRYIFTLGALSYASGRLFVQHDYTNTTLRRLYAQQGIGAVCAVISALLMFFYDKINGLEISDYVVRSTASAWLLPFVIYVVFEVYTTFRISSELKKLDNKTLNKK